MRRPTDREAEIQLHRLVYGRTDETPRYITDATAMLEVAEDWICSDCDRRFALMRDSGRKYLAVAQDNRYRIGKQRRETEAGTASEALFWAIWQSAFWMDKQQQGWTSEEDWDE